VPIPKHLRIVFRGIFTGTPETWSFGVHGQSVVSTHPDATVDDVNLETLVSAWDALADSDAHLPSNARLGDVRVYQIGTDGRAVGKIGLLDVAARNLQGPTSPQYPPQISLAVTTVGATRGAARLGRFYLPTALLLNFTDSRLSAVNAEVTAVAAGTFLKACSNAIDLPDQLGSAQMVNVSSRGGPDGTLQAIDHVEVGRVLDTLRSRRRALVEERFAGAHIDW